MELFRDADQMLTIVRGLNDEELRSLVQMHEDPVSDEQIEFYILACFLLSSRVCSNEHLEQAIHRTEGWVAETAADHPDRPRRIQILDMMVAILCQQRLVVENTNSIVGDLVRHDSEWLGNAVMEAYEHTGDITILNRAISMVERAIEMAGDGVQPESLSNLGNMLVKRFERTGSADDLDCAIERSGSAVNALGPPIQRDSRRAIMLHNHSVNLGKRFEVAGSMDDINAAIDFAGLALKAVPHGDRLEAAVMYGLGCCLGALYSRTRSIADLNRAILVDIMVAIGGSSLLPKNDYILANASYDLGNHLRSRFMHDGSIDDLSDAIDCFVAALDTMPQEAIVLRARASALLGDCLGHRFERTGSADDLNHAISIAEEGIGAMPLGHSDRANLLIHLCGLLYKRYQQTKSIDDRNRVLAFYNEGRTCPAILALERVRLARRAAQILIAESNWTDACSILDEAVRLLSFISPRSLNDTDKRHKLSEFGDLASVATSVALQAGKEACYALQLLELGRGVVFSLLMDLRGDISHLKRENPNLAEEYITLRNELDSPADEQSHHRMLSDKKPTWVSQGDRRREAEREFNLLIARIRGLPGLDRFLLPPTSDEMMAAADPDPIVAFNITKYRFDAFLVERQQIRVLQLSSLAYEAFRGLVIGQATEQGLRDIRAFFQSTSLPELLWDFAARPILDELGFTGPVSDDNWPHVWWISAGTLAEMPFHAAGLYTAGSTETVLDRVVSSYAMSIKTLILERRQHVRNNFASGGLQTGMSDLAVLVAMQETPGMLANGILTSATAELDVVKDICTSESLKLQPLIPAPRKDDVLKHLQNCKIFHFAGHGQSDQENPWRSCLHLEDWESNPLTVGDLRYQRLRDNPPFLGFLSACSTGTRPIDAPEEAEHLISALQLAGFRHVVGTLWEVSDQHCVEVARVFYETLRDEGMTDLAVRRGLHFAIRALRDKELEEAGDMRNARVVNSETPLRRMMGVHWVPYIHYGI